MRRGGPINTEDGSSVADFPCFYQHECHSPGDVAVVGFGTAVVPAFGETQLSASQTRSGAGTSDIAAVTAVSLVWPMIGVTRTA
jgi:hypothetical protein